ncbi:MAG: twin-arginine translocation signal domain-containing protein [Halothiobacillus sp.]|nr:twin-arginine translocation signal domain-containing protein [Halothiobacillus sp.]
MNRRNFMKAVGATGLSLGFGLKGIEFANAAEGPIKVGILHSLSGTMERGAIQATGAMSTLDDALTARYLTV